MYHPHVRNAAALADRRDRPTRWESDFPPHEVMQCAGAVLESANLKLELLGQSKDLGMPKFLPVLPQPPQDRLEALVERETAKFWARLQRRRAKPPMMAKSGTRTKRVRDQ